jgi:hypothetical protein
MVNGAPPRWTVSSPLPGPSRFEATAIQEFSSLTSAGPVLYASDLDVPGAKERLVRRLLARLSGLETAPIIGAGRGPLFLETSALGQPRLVLAGRPGPAVSFSRAAGRVWAALTVGGQVGIDAALAGEFEVGYPCARAFRNAELDWARPLSGDTAGAAALLWAVKEAAVKALGVGFHLLDPLAVEVFKPRAWQGGFQVSVQAGRTLSAWARPEGGGWLAIARFN